MVLFFIEITRPFILLLKKYTEFKQNKEVEKVLIKVRDYICNIAKMVDINYSEGIREFIVMVDISFIGWGVVLFQV